VTGRLRRLVDRFTGRALPDGFTGTLDAEENVLGVAEVRDGTHLVATSHGLWVPGDDGDRRIGWHLISKATWADGGLTVVESRESDRAGDAVLLADLPPRRYVIAEPGELPHQVHRRVTDSIRTRHHRELPGGGAWFVQRKAPGSDGILLQVRADPGTDPAAVSRFAAEVAEKLRAVRDAVE
jgi:hypothetical protein